VENGRITSFEPNDGHRKKWLTILAACIVIVAALLLLWLFMRPATDDKQFDKNGNSSQPEKPMTPLEVSIETPTEGQMVSGEVTVKATVDDPSRVSRVELYVDSVFMGVVYTEPFEFELDTTKLTEGAHDLLVEAFDEDGRSYSSKLVRIIVELADETGEGTPKSSSSSGSASSGSGGSGGSGGGGSPDDDDEEDEDTTAPTAPANLLLSAEDGYTTNLAWDASTDDTGVSSYNIYRDGALLGTVLGASTTTYQDQTVVPGNTYEYAVEALDAADNASAASNEPSITLVPTSIWIAADSPQGFGGDPQDYELGVKFRPLVNGEVSGVRFYKNPSDTGSHTINLWSISGTNLASAAVTGETASGWQQATFAAPVAVVAGTTYIVSYSSPDGFYSFTSGYFATEGITSQYLTAMASGVDGNNGVFANDDGDFPDQSFNNTNYWVDALFIPNLAAGGPTAKALDNSEVHPGYPGSNNTGVPVGKRLPSRDREVVIYEDGAIMENIEVTGQITIRADDVTIRKSDVSGFVYLDTDDPSSPTWYVTIEDSEINSGTNERAAVSLGQFTLLRANMRGGHIGALCGGDCIVTDSWLHDQYLPPNDDWHLGGFLSNGGSDILLEHNTISCDPANNGFGGGCTGDLNLIADFAAIENITINDNFLKANADAGYCLLAGYNAGKPFGLAANNIDITNNIFERGTSGTCASFGVATDYSILGSPSPGSSWVNNRYDDGTVIPAP
jgi:hypothetical protein